MPADSAPLLDRRARLAAPALRRDLTAVVRRRVRGDEADDVVQATFADVLSAAEVPDDAEEFRRFVFGVARNKVFDHFRRRQRDDAGRDPRSEDAQELSEPELPLSARDLLRWAEGKLPDSESKHTLEWMLREGDGEKLEQIAREAQLPAPRVRQRVSRLRKLLRESWAAELLLAGLGLLLFGFVALHYYAERKRPGDVVEREPVRPRPSAEPGKPAGSQRSPLPVAPSAAPTPSVAPTPSASTKTDGPLPRPGKRPQSVFGSESGSSK